MYYIHDQNAVNMQNEKIIAKERRKSVLVYLDIETIDLIKKYESDNNLTKQRSAIIRAAVKALLNESCGEAKRHPWIPIDADFTD